MPLGIVVRKTPGVTRWAKWHWQAVAIMPGAAQESWRELRRDGDAVEYHAATVDLELWRTDAEAYLTGLSTRVPSIYVVLREATDPDAPHAVEVLLATASPYDAQDYADSGEEIVDLVPMSEPLIAWVREFVDAHYEEERFVKRKRDKKRIDRVEDGIGDARISQMSDVYRSPTRPKNEPIH
ncbi:MAG: DUF3305 domain-containing protein [Rhodobacteraceae bacterium]|nr:DUF3305 domain-containing protein [Paracoccaceae bacterium]